MDNTIDKICIFLNFELYKFAFMHGSLSFVALSFKKLEFKYP